MSTIKDFLTSAIGEYTNQSISQTISLKNASGDLLQQIETSYSLPDIEYICACLLFICVAVSVFKIIGKVGDTIRVR